MITRNTVVAVALATASVLAIANGAQAQSRDTIRIVGSSTVFPFSTAVAEFFGNNTEFPTPVVESTGSGGGLKLFCAGVGIGHPDITNASRAIKTSEIKTCAANGVIEVTEVKVGFDGIVLANRKSADRVDLTRAQIWQALAETVVVDGELVTNPYETWADIDASLPDNDIEVLGPPPTSGTRDAFVELVMEKGCKAFDLIKNMDKKARKEPCKHVREDGAFVDAGENDNLIVQKLEANPEAFGIFGYSFLDQNLDKIQGSLIEGVEPEFDLIADGSYPVSRPLFFYVKNAHVGVVPGIQEFIENFTDDGAWGPDGYLTDKGLIPLPTEERTAARTRAVNLTPIGN